MTTSAPVVTASASKSNGTTPVASAAPVAGIDVSKLSEEQKKALRAALRPVREAGPKKALALAYFKAAGEAWETWQAGIAAAGATRKDASLNPWTAKAAGGSVRKQQALAEPTAAQVKALVAVMTSKAQSADAVSKALGGKDAGWSQVMVAHVAAAAVAAKKITAEATDKKGRFNKAYRLVK